MSIISQFIFQKLWSWYHKGLLYWPERRMDWASPTWGDHLRLWSISQPSWSQSPSGYPTDTLYFLRAGQDSHRGIVSEDVWHPAGKDKERCSSKESWMPQPLSSFVSGACCRNLTYGSHHIPRKGCMGPRDNCGSLGPYRNWVLDRSVSGSHG